MFQRTIYGDANGLAHINTLVSPTTFHNAFPKPLDPIVEDPEFAIYSGGKSTKDFATKSTEYFRVFY